MHCHIGTIVFINNYELNLSTRYWTQPEQFKPERFLEYVPVTATKKSFTSNDIKLHDTKDSNAQNRTRSESDSASDSGVECEDMDSNKSTVSHSEPSPTPTTATSTKLLSDEMHGAGQQLSTANGDEQRSVPQNVKPRIRKNIPHFLPFSIGKRTCIGQNLVRGFSFIIVANLLQQYNVDISDKSLIKMYPGCVAVPMETYPLSLTPRKH